VYVSLRGYSPWICLILKSDKLSRLSGGGEYFPMKIMIADDHPLVHSAIPNILRKLEDDVQILAASDFPETLSLVEQHQDLDLLLLDLDMPGMDWFEALSLLRTNRKELRIIILSASQNPSDVYHALSLEIRGYIPKTTGPEIIEQALRMVLAGGKYVPPELMSGMALHAMAPNHESTETKINNSKIVLTRRQRDVLQSMMDGNSNKEIARSLNLSEATVKVHVTAIFRALKVRSRSQAVLAAERCSIFNEIRE
jgi:DNA-binding NarL/FixJ family response regulator